MTKKFKVLNFAATKHTLDIDFKDIDQNQKYQPWCLAWAAVTSRASQRKLRLRAKIPNTMFKDF